MYNKSFFFSAKGRISRQDYLLYFSLPFSLVSFIVGIAPIFYLPLRVPSLLAMIPLMICGIIVGIRRLHDTDRTGKWMFLMIVPFAGPIYLLAVMWFLKGTKGDNRFGPDPRTGVDKPESNWLVALMVALTIFIMWAQNAIIYSPLGATYRTSLKVEQKAPTPNGEEKDTAPPQPENTQH